jgi:hypothetical protein
MAERVRWIDRVWDVPAATALGQRQPGLSRADNADEGQMASLNDACRGG